MKLDSEIRMGIAMGTSEYKDARSLYIESLSLIEKLHRRLLDVIKAEFDRSGRGEINSVQALLIYNIGELELTAGELQRRGYYLGSNVSYNLKKLVDGGYVRHERSRFDRRTVHISLTQKGREIAQIVNDFFNRHVSVDQVDGMSSDEFMALNNSLKKLDYFWTHLLQRRQ